MTVHSYLRAPMAVLAVMLASGLAAQAELGREPAPSAPARPPVTTLPPVVIETTSKHEKDVFTTPDALSVVSKERIAARVPEDLGDAVAREPGVYTQRTAAGQASPFVRGLTGKQVLLMVDGIRYNNSAFRFGPNQYFASIDPWFADRVEIVRGPYSVLYGSDALGGVINVISRKPRLFESMEFHPAIAAQNASGNNGRRVTGDLPLSFDRSLAIYASASMGNYGRIVGGPNIGEQPFTAYHDMSGTGGLTWIPAARWRVDWRLAHKSQYNVYRTDKNSTLVADPTKLPTADTGERIGSDYLQVFPRQDDTFTYLNAHYDESAPDAILRSLDVDMSYHRMNEEFERIRHSAVFTLRDQLFTVDTMGLTATAVLDIRRLAETLWSDSLLTVGIDVYNDTIGSGRDDVNRVTGARTPRPEGAQFPDGASYTSMGVYAQDDISINNGLWTIRPGLRFSMYQADAKTSVLGNGELEDVDRSFNDVTGALAVGFNPLDWFSTSIGVARGFRAPNLDDLAAAKGTGRGEEIPNPDLNPEELWAVQLGGKAFIPNIVKGSAAPYRLTAQAAYFEHWLNDLMVSTPTTFGGEDVVQLQNTTRARINGWEFGAQYYFGRELAAVGMGDTYALAPGDALAVWGNITYTHGDDLSGKVPLNRMPPVMFEGGLRYEVKGGAAYVEPSIEIWGRQGRYGPAAAGDVRFGKPRTAGYALYHVAAGWRTNEHFSLRLAVHNLTNKNYQVLGSGVFGAGTDARVSAEVRW